MKQPTEYKLNRINLKGYRLLSACLLITLVVLSSCVVRKGIQYFLSNDTVSNMQNGKMAKIGLNPNGQLNALSAACEKLSDTKNDLLSFTSQHNSGNAFFIVLYCLLPAFLISLFTVFKDNLRLPVPYSLLHWSQLPLFLQNRLLLI